MRFGRRKPKEMKMRFEKNIGTEGVSKLWDFSLQNTVSPRKEFFFQSLSKLLYSNFSLFLKIFLVSFLSATQILHYNFFFIRFKMIWSFWKLVWKTNQAALKLKLNWIPRNCIFRWFRALQDADHIRSLKEKRMEQKQKERNKWRSNDEE